VGQSETLKQYLAAMARFRTYSLHNVLLIKYQRPDATRVAGYRKWREFGRQVKLGTKGILILAPIFRCPAKDACEEEHSRPVIAYRGVHVFDVLDTTGSPLADIGRTQGDPSGYTERLKEFVTESGIQLQYSEAIYPAQGRSSPGKIE
jgi:N-terminal domain of anti-restriction factor ArdC